jgi:beta-N-acetylhexosaminidase
MIGHLDVQALAPGTPSSIAPETYAYLREELGFGGVAITDSLGMGAVAGIPALAVKALEAGADLLLMPADTRRTHATVTAALEDGTLDRARVEEAAARVVALQRWQARIAAERPVGEDVEEQAAAASAALSAAAYGS